MSNNVLVIGTGTIGKPLRGLLEKRRNELGIDAIAFHKNSTQPETVGSVGRALRRGSLLVTEADKADEFRSLGFNPAMTRQEALSDWADVVVDCTPDGMGLAHLTGKARNKKGVEIECDPWYTDEVQSRLCGLVAQGSENGFGVPYALGVNDEAVEGKKRIQVVSCNTHNLLVVYRTIERLCGRIRRGRFMLVRRHSDLSQQTMIASPQVDRHKDQRFGTHHALDAHRVLQTLGDDPNIVSSSMQVGTQYMHTLQFNIEVEVPPSAEEVIEAFRARPYVAITRRMNAAQLFSEARDDGFNGRMLDQTVVAANTLQVLGNDVVGFCFTPQDGNSLLTSVAAVTRSLHPEDWRERLNCFQRYHFDEV
jgi:glyceraldehyde-3-phosphate dehydrogenase (NAD(P))